MDKAEHAWQRAWGRVEDERIMRRYTAVTDQTLRAAAEAVSGSEAGGFVSPVARHQLQPKV